MSLSQVCSEHGISLYALSPKTTRLAACHCQYFFTYYLVTDKQWQLREENVNQTKWKFCTFLQKVLHENFSQTKQGEFYACSLYPFNTVAVNNTKCVQDLFGKLGQSNQTQSISSSSIYQINKDTIKNIWQTFRRTLNQCTYNYRGII